MKIILDQDGSIELLRGDRIVRGQKGSKIIVVGWKTGCSPVERNEVLQENFSVRICITRPDGEQTGWHLMSKVDNEQAYFYPLELWDTLVDGEAKVSVQWYDCTEEEPEVIGVSQQGKFIIDDSAIAQPLPISNENYNKLEQLIAPISSQAFRKYDATRIPSVIDYQQNGKKNAPSLYYNATMNVKTYNGATNTYTDTEATGTLFVGVEDLGNNTKCQSEMFIVSNRVYMRELVISHYDEDEPIVDNASESDAQFYEIGATIKDYIKYQIENYGYSKDAVDKMFKAFKESTELSVKQIIETYKEYFDEEHEALLTEFDNQFGELDRRLKDVEHSWFTRIPGEEISDEELISHVLGLPDGFYIANTAQFGEEQIYISQNNDLIARYTATGASYQLDKEIMEWIMSAGGGGGGGGGGSGSNLRLTALLTGLQFTTAVGATTILTYNFKSSIAGRGTARYYVNQTLQGTSIINQGNNTFDATNFVASGTTYITVEVTDSAGSVAKLDYIINGVELKLSSPFDDVQAYTGDIEFRYLVSGDVSKTIHFVLDGTELETATTESTRQQVYTISALSHGVHNLIVYAVANINGIDLTSNELTYKVIAYEEGKTDIIIASKFDKTEAMEGDVVAVDYIVYSPNATSSTVSLKINGEEKQSLSVDRTKQYWYIRNLVIGENTLEIACGDTSLTFPITITEAELNVEPVTENLELFLDAYGRSNSEQNRDVWAYNDIEAQFENFNWSTNGWIDNALRLNGLAKVTIPFKIFESDFRTYGKTIEFEFATRDVATIDTIAIVSYSGNRGIRLKMNEALIQSEQSAVTTKYKDDERIRVSFVIDSKDGLRLIRTFVNGVLSGLAQYPANDDFSQTSPVGITINPDGGSVDIYKIRVYDTALTDQDMLINYIADLDSMSDKVEMYNHNNIFDTNGEVSYTKVKGKIATVVITGPMPASKGDKKSGKITYENPLNISRNFEQACTVDVQGTSSQYYPRKNLKIKLTNAIDFFGNGLQENVYTIKVNYMESGNRNNTGIANFIHGETGQIYDEQVPPQVENSAIRTCIQGEPVVIFHKPTESSTPVFYAIGDYNNDKSNANTLGFANYPLAESWEFKDNDEPLCLFNSVDFTRNANAFEARYPEDNTNFTQIDNLVTWVHSTIGDLDKFKTEFEEHFNLHYTLMYYILTEMFGMIDSRAKNMFLNTWDGVIWYPVFYDMDTAFGLNNEGVNNFNYNIEYGDQIGSQSVFNGSKSVLWNNFKNAFEDEIKALYQSLRNSGKISADAVLEALDKVTKDFSKALYNVDAGNKYIAPLEEDGDATYLYCAQGDRREHLKWWINGRIKYLDSKYYSSDYASDYISMRIYSPDDTTTTSVVPFNGAFNLKSFMAQYLGVRYGANGELFQVRAEAEVATKVSATASTDLNDKETYVYGASLIKDLGDLSNKYVGTLDVSKAVKLSKLIVGNSNSKYSNTNLIDLQIGNNDLLTYLDIRNCPNLTQTVDLSGCKNIQEVYATGTGITSITLAEGGNLKTLTLPATITNLTLKNQPLLTNLTLADKTKVSTLVIESCNTAIDSLIFEIVNTSTELSRVRLINVDWSMTDKTVFDKLMKCGGIDENNNNTDKSIITGKVHFTSIGQNDMDTLKAYYPNLTISYDSLMEEFTVTFLDWDDTVLEVQYVTKGNSATDPVTRTNNPIPTPTREKDAQYTYTFSGWDGTLASVYTNRTVKAKYSTTINTYTINFYNNSSGTAELLYTQTNVPYGTPAKFTGTNPVYAGSGTGTYVFSGWTPDITFIEGDVEAYAVFSEMVVPSEIKSFADCTWAEVKAVLTNGTVNNSNQWVVGEDVWFEVGDEKPITLLNGETLTIQIADFNHDVDDSGNTVPCTFITKELMATSKAMNSTNTNAGGWANSAMYSYLQSDVYDLLPTDIQVLLVPVVKKSTEGSQSTNIISSTDKLFLLSYSEVGFGTSSPYGDEGTQYPIFTNSTSRKKYKVGSTSATSWWLRSPYAGSSAYFWYVYSTGTTISNSAYTTNGVCFAFAM